MLVLLTIKAIACGISPSGNLHLKLNLSFSLKFSSTNIPPISIMLPKSVEELDDSISQITIFNFHLYFNAFCEEDYDLASKQVASKFVSILI